MPISPRTDQEMLDLILRVAHTDSRIRAVWLPGSRVDPAATQDRFSDFDVVYLVDGLPSMVQDEAWLEPFGPPLIVQRPDDWFNHPYDLTSHANFAYLMYFPDGQRIDLTLVALDHIQLVLSDPEPEPRHVLLDKNEIADLSDVPAGQFGRVFPPTEREFAETCNEFWWLSLSAAKGIERGEVLSAKTLMERYQLDMLLQALAWKTGIRQGFPLACGKFFKYLPGLLDPDDHKRLMGILSAAPGNNQWTQLLAMCDLFAATARKIVPAFDLSHDLTQYEAVRQELKLLRR